jgi:hypothetical protein
MADVTGLPLAPDHRFNGHSETLRRGEIQTARGNSPSDGSALSCIDVACRAPSLVGDIGPIGDEAAIGNELAQVVYCRQLVPG